jgi:hypothetical protein
MNTPQNINVDIKKNSTAIKCEKCEGESFIGITFLRKVSRLITGTSQDQIIPIPSFQCSVCNHINKEFIPKFEDK